MLSEIEAFDKNKLKKTTTKITFSNGRQINIKKNENNEEIIEELNESTHGFIHQLDPDYSCDEIIPHLYLSGDDVAKNIDILKSKSITHILNLTTNIENLFESNSIIYRRIILYDLPNQPLTDHFDNAFEFIDKALLYNNINEINNVLVHCNAGVSRSASVVIAYLMKKGIFGTYKDAYNHVKQSRSKISPNYGFRQQLEQYEKMIHSSTKNST